MNLWNERFLAPPPTTFCKLSTQELNLQELFNRLIEIETLFSQQIQLDVEINTLQLLIKGNKVKYRTHIGFKHLLKLNKCLRNMQELDYKNIVFSYRGLVPYKYEAETYFPSRNMLDYLLVRTQGNAQLFCRVFYCIEFAHKNFYDMWKLGHNVAFSFVVISLVSRIFVILRYLLKHLCEFYSELIPLRKKLSNVEFEWIPVEYIFPTNLREWLDVEWIFTNVTIIQPKHRNLLSINIDDNDDDERERNTIEDEEDLRIVNEYMNILDSDEEMVQIENTQREIAKINEETKFTNNIPVVDLDDSDIGEPVQVSAKLAEVQQKLDNITTVKEAIAFIMNANQNYFSSLNPKHYNNLRAHALAQKSDLELINTQKGKKKKKRNKLLTGLKTVIFNTIKNGSFTAADVTS